MLVLTRNIGEYLVFKVAGLTFRVGIDQVRRYGFPVSSAQVRIAVDADTEVTVLREELLTRPGGES